MSDVASQAQAILSRIHDENPSYWPYGLDVRQFDGGLYLINKSASADPVGFVGWQVREEAGRDIGYYAIGVLPEYRHQGFAKAAVTSLLREKSAGVDEVRAMVMAHNEPSKALAASVGVTVIEKLASIQKVAMSPAAAMALRAITGGVANSTFWDQAMDPERAPSSTFKPWGWDKNRALQGGLNFVLGAGGGALMNKPKGIVAGTALMALTPTKDLAMKGLGSLHRLDEVSKKSIGALENAGKPSAGVLGQIPREILLGALGLGAAGLGVAAYGAKRRGDAAEAQAGAARSGRVRVTLPTKDPNDAETLLDIPIEDIGMSNALRARLGRDTRRRLYDETKKRTRPRKAKDPAKPTEREAEDQALERERADLEKVSTIVSFIDMIQNPALFKAAAAQPAGNVPTPPQPGMNPALRLQGQRTAANSIDTSTAANPQIMKAQQDAALAAGEAQQQVAAAEQAQAQKEMESQQQFQQQMAEADAAKQKVENEKQVLEMELEKSRIHGELMAEKAKAKEELATAQSKATGALSDGQSSVVDKLTQSRIARISGRIKAATAAPEHGIDPATGRPNPPPVKFLRPDAMNNLNRNSHIDAAQGGIAPVGIWRTSMGKPLDWVYNQFFSKPMTTPTTKSVRSRLPLATLLGSSDTAETMDVLQRYGDMQQNRSDFDQLQNATGLGQAPFA